MERPRVHGHLHRLTILYSRAGAEAPHKRRFLLAAGRSLALPSPFTMPVVPGAIALAAVAMLALAAQGIPAYLGLAGLLAVPYLLAASFLAPRIGIGLFLAAIITGQLLGGVVLDHLGAFGAAPRPVDLPRLLGIIALLLGVVLIRGRR